MVILTTKIHAHPCNELNTHHKWASLRENKQLILSAEIKQVKKPILVYSMNISLASV